MPIKPEEIDSTIQNLLHERLGQIFSGQPAALDPVAARVRMAGTQVWRQTTRRFAGYFWAGAGGFAASLAALPVLGPTHEGLAVLAFLLLNGLGLGLLVRAQIDLSLPGGTTVKVGTDRTWKVRESPLTPLGRGLAFGDYGGERYDARLELPGWNTTGLDDSAWKPAALFEPPRVVTAAQMVEPNRLMETLQAVKVQESAPGGYLIDLGRNLTGWFQLRLPSNIPAGTTVKLEYADAPPADNRFRSYNQRDEVVSAGAEMTFRSRFNYHGFRYVRVTGLEQPPALKDASASLIHTAYEPAGEFTCSNDLLNRIHRLTTWTYRCLTLGGYVVDCPTRERLGYGGDAGTSLETGMFNFGAGGLYNRWSADWRAAQEPNTGDLPFTAPHYQDQGGGGPMWSGFIVTLPWQMYLQYDDKRILETTYPSIRKWLGYLQSETVDHLLESHKCYAMRLPQWTFLGDWVPPRRPGQTGRGAPGDPERIKCINNCHYLYQLRLAARIAAVLGKSGEAAEYETKAATLARALHARFYHPETRSYATGEQPYLAFPLLVNAVPPELRGPVTQNLEETIRVKDRGHLNSGMHGTYFLLKHLIEQDRSDLIYEMVSKTDYPGWGYMLEQGATTAWEDWDGRASHIHDTLISVGSWFIQGIGGIRIDEKSPGFKHFLIKPAVVGDLTFARTRYRSPYGPIVSNWRIESGVLHLDVTVPPGTTARVYVPASSPASVTEGGRPVVQSEGVRAMGTENGKAMYEVESGQYSFSSKLAGATAPAKAATVEAVPGAYQVRENIEYAHDPVPLKLDAHIPPGKGPFPAVILVHGGGWTTGDKTASFVRPLFPVLDRTGFAWFTIDYRLAPAYPYTAQVEDVERAIAWVKQNAREYKVNPKKIALMGESAGAHLVNLVGARNRPPANVAAVVSFYGPMNIVDTLHLRPGGPLSDGLKAVFQISALDAAGMAKLREGSPETYLNSRTPPFLFIHGTRDPAVPYAQSTLGVELFRKAGIPSDLITVEDGVHGVINWESDPKFQGYKEQMIDWLRRKLR